MRSTKVKAATAAIVVLSGVGLMGCSDDDSSSDSQETTTTTAAAPEETTTTTDAVVNTGGAVEVFDFEYLPGSIVIAAGQSITWSNTSDNRHTVTSQDDRFASSSTIQGGQSYVQAFPEPGVYPYFCTFHPDRMSGAITVE